MKTLGTKVPPHLAKAAEAEASKHGMNISQWLRWQLRRLTDNEPEPLNEIGDDHQDELTAA